MSGVALSGETRLFPVIGDPIGQVKSPGSLTAILAERGENAIVVPVHAAASDVGAVLEAFARIRNVGGVLVTIPHKVAVLDLCAEATDRARFAGATNVVRKTDRGWLGDNTDGRGYVDGMLREGFDVAGKSALLVGCGGAGSAIAFELIERGVTTLAIHDKDEERRDHFLARLETRFPGRVRVGGSDPAGFDLVANATPLGMRPGDPLPVDVSRFDAGQFVACVVTKPAVPPLIAAARERGCRTMTGKGMFDAQAGALVDFLLAGAAA